MLPEVNCEVLSQIMLVYKILIVTRKGELVARHMVTLGSKLYLLNAEEYRK